MYKAAVIRPRTKQESKNDLAGFGAIFLLFAGQFFLLVLLQFPVPILRVYGQLPAHILTTERILQFFGTYPRPEPCFRLR